MTRGILLISIGLLNAGDKGDKLKLRQVLWYICAMSESQKTADVELDLQGLMCPMPLLKTKKALNGMSPAQVLHVLATDPGSQRDFEVFTQQSGNELLDTQEDNGVFSYLIRKKT